MTFSICANGVSAGAGLGDGWLIHLLVYRKRATGLGPRSVSRLRAIEGLSPPAPPPAHPWSYVLLGRVHLDFFFSCFKCDPMPAHFLRLSPIRPVSILAPFAIILALTLNYEYFRHCFPRPGPDHTVSPSLFPSLSASLVPSQFTHQRPREPRHHSAFRRRSLLGHWRFV